MKNVITMGHFFNLYISLIWKTNLLSFPMPLHLAFVVDPCREGFIFLFSPMPPLIPDLGFHFSLDIVTSIYSPFIQVNVHPRNKVVERIDTSFMLGSPFQNLNFLRLMIKNWKMLTREVEE
jgi:hypothetical protein